ncbi:glycosyltransferase [Butyrivibrio sp. AE3006]|uniref:glycosyltransferase n=1 Tax=Butyrivibrio sp. AE3006 TaxID=1280673 RepID=UPI00041FE353|nr:glycosyltransferase [Butyrivibrio sp. AE3006]
MTIVNILVGKIRSKINSIVLWRYRNIPISKSGIKQRLHPQIIISLTSYPERFETLHIAIASLLNQTFKPDMVLLYLGNDSINVTLPKQVTELTKYGLKIIYKDENLGSHKKIYYALQEYPNDIIITADDDLVYERNHVLKLMKSYRKYPHCLSTKRASRMLVDDEGRLKKYSKWGSVNGYHNVPRDDLFSTIGAGTLFPPHIFSKYYDDKNTIYECCYNVDDVWVKFMALLNDVKVVCTKGKDYIPIEEAAFSENALFMTNIGQDRNDKCIHELESKYHILLSDYCEKV